MRRPAVAARPIGPQASTPTHWKKLEVEVEPEPRALQRHRQFAGAAGVVDAGRHEEAERICRAGTACGRGAERAGAGARASAVRPIRFWAANDVASNGRISAAAEERYDIVSTPWLGVGATGATPSDHVTGTARGRPTGGSVTALTIAALFSTRLPNSSRPAEGRARRRWGNHAASEGANALGPRSWRDRTMSPRAAPCFGCSARTRRPARSAEPPAGALARRAPRGGHRVSVLPVPLFQPVRAS